MSLTFTQLLERLPKKFENSELIQDINVTAEGSKINIVNIKPGEERAENIFNVLPIEVVATGEYHNLGLFVSGLSDLLRIITVGDFSVESNAATQGSNSLSSGLKVVMTLDTYRSNEEDKAAKAAEAAPAEGAPK